MNKKVVAIDGSSLLTTSFWGTAPKEYMRAKTDEERSQAVKKMMQTSTGVYTNGVFAMVKTLLSIIEEQKPTHLFVAWDLSRNTFRRQIFEDYKGHREETKTELKSQFKLAQQVLSDMNIAQFILEGYEADDIIGTLSKKFQDEAKVFIWAKDQDALQLVNDRVRLWFQTSKVEAMYEELGLNHKDLKLPEGCFEFTPPLVKHFYGVEPIQIIDRKAIEGDASDGIPGIPGVGEASSVPLIREFISIENLYDWLEDTSEKEAKAFMKELGIKRSPYSHLMKTSETELVGKESALLSKKLATIDTNVEALRFVSLDDVELDIDQNGMTRKFEELEFKSLLKEEKKTA